MNFPEDLSILLYAISPIVYMLPTLIARARRPGLRVGYLRIAVLNLLLGWTVIGWFVLLRKALLEETEPTPPIPEPAVLDPPADSTAAMDFEDPDARPDIVDQLEQQGQVEIHHRKSGVRVRVAREGEYRYSVEVPTASLDPSRGQRHRAHGAVSEVLWRQYDHDAIDSAPELADTDPSWGYSLERTGVSNAVGNALRLLCTIADVPKVEAVEDLDVHPH